MDWKSVSNMVSLENYVYLWLLPGEPIPKAKVFEELGYTYLLRMVSGF